MTDRPAPIPAHRARAIFADGMLAGGRICESDHPEMLAAAAERGALRALLVVLGLAIAAVWMRRR